MRSNQPMPLPELQNPEALTKEKVDAAIGHKTAGLHVLGALGDNKVMSVSYVGRSDDDLAAKLKRHAGNYAGFAFATTASALHPIGKRGPDWACPIRGQQSRCARTRPPDARSAAADPKSAFKLAFLEMLQTISQLISFTELGFFCCVGVRLDPLSIFRSHGLPDVRLPRSQS